MKIALLSPTNPYVSQGATYNITGLKEGLESIGNEVYLIGLRKIIGEKKNEEKIDPIKNVILVPYWNIIPRRWYFLRDKIDRRWQKKATKQLKKLYKKKKIDLVILRYVYYPHMTLEGIKDDFKGKTAILSYPIVIGQSQLGNIPKQLIKDMKRLEKLSLEKTDKILAYSPIVKDIIVDEYDIDKQKISIIRPGSHIDKFKVKGDLRKKLNWTNKFVVGYIGNVVSWQGLEYLIKSIPFVRNKFNHVLLVIIGHSPDVEYKKKLDGIIKDLCLEDHVRFYNSVPHDDVPLYLNSFDILAAPYAKTDPPMSIVFPIKLAEALAAGCRIVTTNQPGLSWVIKDRENGMLAEPNDPKSIADKIIELMKSSELAENISANARKTAEMFDWKTIAKEVIDNIKKD